MLHIIGVHNNENTEQSDSDEEAKIFQASSDFRRQNLREPLLYSDERLLWIHRYSERNIAEKVTGINLQRPTARIVNYGEIKQCLYGAF